MSAKNSRVPENRRTSAKTSFQALCLSVRATASDSNPTAASFNLLSQRPPHARARGTPDGRRHRALALRATLEADNCASALWLFSSATASLLSRSACCFFAYRAKNIRSARCRKSSANKTIRQQETGPKKTKRTSRKPRRSQRKLPGTKLVSQRRSHGQTQIRNHAAESHRYA